MKHIGANIRALREQQGLTQEELAGRLFVTRQTLSNYENGRTRPDLDMLLKIAETLGRDVTDLLYGPVPTEEQRRQRRQLLTGGAASLAALAAVLIARRLDPFRQTYDISVRMLTLLLLQPLFALLLGWTLTHAVFLLTRARPLHGPRLPAARRTLLAALAVYLLLVLPDVLSAALVSLQLHFGMETTGLPTPWPLWNRLTGWAVRGAARLPWLFAVAGGLLRLWNFPARRQSPEAPPEAAPQTP